MLNHPLSSHLLVGLQFVCIVLVIYPFNDVNHSTAWLLVSLMGGLIGIYTLLHNRLGNFGVYPELVNNAELIMSGPYRWIRHPMYLSLLLFTLGIALYNGSLWNLLGVALLVPVLLGKIDKEEMYLKQQFSGYQQYCLKSKRLLPYIY